MSLALLSLLQGLKQSPRRGWLQRGVAQPESVAEHTFAMLTICDAYPWPNELDRLKALQICLYHDAAEVITGDITPADNVDKATKHMRESLAFTYMSCLDDDPQATFSAHMKALWLEYEGRKTKPAVIVHQIDKLEAILQALLYQRTMPRLDFSDFRRLRELVKDEWLSKVADEALAQWDSPSFDKFEPKIIFVVGGPGVGKGTQCSLAAERFGLAHVSMGELLRAESDAKSRYGEFIQESIRAGVVVPAQLAMKLLKQALEQASQERKRAVLIDGFPRSIEQRVAFETQISTHYCTVHMECTDDELVDRLLKRSSHSGRPDDEPLIMKRRVDSYRKPLLSVLEGLAHSIYEVSCSGTISDVEKRFGKVIQEILAKE